MLIGVAGPVAGGVAIGAGALWLLVVSLVSSAMSAIVLAALYMYGVTNQVPQAFDASLLTGAFARK
jgi:TctA family transporter